MDLRTKAEAVMEAAWREPGYTVPNPVIYPHQWLWDSCFHSLVWASFDRPDRAVTELRSALSAMTPSGFVPHMIYWTDPASHQPLWGRSGVSAITQPPMYGHALAELVRAGAEVDDLLLVSATTALRHLFDGHRRTGSGLVAVFHPWETGCDDSPRWDGARSPDGSITDWRARKAELVSTIVHTDDGAPVANGAFTVGSVGFSALVAWNARELASVTGDTELERRATDLVGSIVERWDPMAGTWRDDWGSTVLVGPDSSSVKTLDAALALLVDRRDEAFDQLVDEHAFGARFGPRGVHQAELAYDPFTYWRGPAWPQLTYLVKRAADAAGRSSTAAALADGLVAGAAQSRLAEYWNPDSGLGLGARPQSWTALAVLFAD